MDDRELTSLHHARAFMDDNYSTPLKLEQISRAANFSPFHFIRLFRKTFHQTPHQYFINKRIEKARELLANSDLNVTDICFEVGFESPASFSTLFRKIVGWAPSVYRARVQAMRRTPRKFIPNCYIVMYRLSPRSRQRPSDCRGSFLRAREIFKRREQFSTSQIRTPVLYWGNSRESAAI